MVQVLSQREFSGLLASPMLAEALSPVSGTNYVVVDLASTEAATDASTFPAAPVVGVGATAGPSYVDVCVAEEELEGLLDAIDGNATAAAALAQVLRHNQHASIADGLMVESLTYGTLQQSASFRAWLAGREPPTPSEDAEPVLIVDRRASTLTLTFNRPARHNAYSEALKDALCEALQVPLADTSIGEVVLRGNGKSFCAGGDLSEFGAVSDAGLAHLSRRTRSAAPMMAALADRIRVEVHGACIGAGIELPAFAGTIVAKPDAFFQLPEVAMGLIPGAGGTVSICKRIGRQQTAYMALTNKRIDAETALSWGLVDELSRP